MESLGLFLDGFVPENGSWVKGVELEGESPSFWISIVALEDIASWHFLPLVNRFFNDGEVEEGEKGAFSCS